MKLIWIMGEMRSISAIRLMIIGFMILIPFIWPDYLKENENKVIWICGLVFVVGSFFLK